MGFFPARDVKGNIQNRASRFLTYKIKEIIKIRH